MSEVSSANYSKITQVKKNSINIENDDNPTAATNRSNYYLTGSH